MKPGIKLDKLIAIHVMGRRMLRPYSTKMDAAWSAVKKVKPTNIRISEGEEGKHLCEINKKYKGLGETAPHAICLALLEAVGYKEENE